MGSTLNNTNLDVFFKVPVKVRLKDDRSLIDKVFNRKNYQDPYNDVEDKVGIRFVVLLTNHIEVITKIIDENSLWTSIRAKDYEQDKERASFIFISISTLYFKTEASAYLRRD